MLKKKIKLAHFSSISLILKPGSEIYFQMMKDLKKYSLISIDPNIRKQLIKNKNFFKTRFNNFLKIADIIKLSNEDFSYLYDIKKADEIISQWLTKNNILFPNKIRIAEDEYFLAKILTEFKNAKTFNKTIYIHNDRKNSLSSNLSGYDSNLDFINLFNLFCKLYLNKNYKKNESLLLVRYIKILYTRIISLLLIRNNYELKNISRLIKKNYSPEIIKILNDLKLTEYKKLAQAKNVNQLKDLIKENINIFEKNFGKPKNIYIYCKSLLAKSLVKICENLDINVIAIIDDAQNNEKKFFKHKLIDSNNMIKNIKKNKLSYKIIVANNRELTFKKIKKKLVKSKINSKNILHFY